ncbi:hypothetical protein QMN05_29835, partial [Klebsiella pneumoniae]
VRLLPREEKFFDLFLEVAKRCNEGAVHLKELLSGKPERWAYSIEAIKRLAVRGAPLIGVAAAYGLAMELAHDESPEALERAAALMAGARPTARNLGWAVERVTAAALAAPGRMADAAR